MSKSTIVKFIAQAPADRRAEAKRRMAAFAKERSEYHQQRADYWYRIQTECDQEACDIEDGARDQGTEELRDKGELER